MNTKARKEKINVLKPTERDDKNVVEDVTSEVKNCKGRRRRKEKTGAQIRSSRSSSLSSLDSYAKHAGHWLSIVSDGGSRSRGGSEILLVRRLHTYDFVTLYWVEVGETLAWVTIPLCHMGLSGKDFSYLEHKRRKAILIRFVIGKPKWSAQDFIKNCGNAWGLVRCQ